MVIKMVEIFDPHAPKWESFEDHDREWIKDINHV